jgi:hypothetical protein
MGSGSGYAKNALGGGIKKNREVATKLNRRKKTCQK